MSVTAAQRALRDAAKQRSFTPVYYLYGEDDYQKIVATRELIDAASDPATRDFNVEYLRGSDLDAETLGSHLSTPPMMAERRVIVLREVTTLRKDARGMLDRYLARPAADLLLILVAGTGDKPDRSLVSSSTAVEYAPLTGDRIPKWITYYVEHDLSSTITEGAVKLLQEAVGTDLAQLKIELDKTSSFTGGGAINEAAVSAVVGVRPGETMGDFLDAVARRDAAVAFGLIPTMLEQPKSNAVTMIMALTSQTLVIGWAQAARARGTPPGRLSNELFTLLKESGSVFTGRSWGEFVSCCARASDTWTADAVDDGLQALLDADSAIKETRLSSDEQILGTLVLRLCGAPARRRAA